MVTVWASLFRNDESYEDGFRDRSWRDENWVTWAPVALERASITAKAAETFASAVARGSHCAAFTNDPSGLPPDLIQSADYSLTLSRLSASDVAAIVKRVCGSHPSISVTDDDAAMLTPRLLRLARRSG